MVNSWPMIPVFARERSFTAPRVTPMTASLVVSAAKALIPFHRRAHNLRTGTPDAMAIFDDVLSANVVLGSVVSAERVARATLATTRRRQRVADFR